MSQEKILYGEHIAHWVVLHLLHNCPFIFTTRVSVKVLVGGVETYFAGSNKPNSASLKTGPALQILI